MIINMIFASVIIYNLYKIHHIYKKSKILSKTLFFNPALVGVYVKFEGVIKEKNRFYKESKKNCVFYFLKVTAFWKVKAKKPSSGYQTISKSKSIHQENSFLLLNEFQELWVRVDSNSLYDKNSYYKINKEIKKTKEPIFKEILKDKKYKSYETQIEYLEDGDRLTVYGRLIQENDKFILTNTYHKKFPFLIMLGDNIFAGKIYAKDFYYCLAYIVVSLIICML